MKLNKIIEHMEKWAPKYLIDSWDNTGFQIGREDREIENVIIALDLDDYVFKKALEKKVDLIITHHPIIFKSLSSIIDKNPNEKLILDIIQSGIAAYNAHSNLDLAIGGVSDALANKLELNNISNLNTVIKEDIEYGYGRIGEIAETSLENFIETIKRVTNIENLILYGGNDKLIKKIAVCGGSGSDFIEDAVNKNADLYITGDIKYHEAQFADERGLSLIDIGHFNSEKHILPIIKKYLDKEFIDLNIEIIMEQSLPQKIY